MKAIVLWTLRIGLILFLSSRVWGTSIDASTSAIQMDTNATAATSAASNLVSPVAAPLHTNRDASPKVRDWSAAGDQITSTKASRTSRPVLLLAAAGLALALARTRQNRRAVFDYYSGH